MSDTSISPEHAVKVLNRLAESDREAIAALLNYRVSCNETLAEDPTCQVRLESSKGEGESETPSYSVGLLGILNAIFPADEGVGKIMIIADPTAKNEYHNARFEVITDPSAFR